MKHIKLMVLALIAASALSGATAASSQAVIQCMRVAEPGTGNWTNSTCTEKVGTQPKEYIRVNEPGQPLGGGIMCAEVVEPNTGNYTDPQCITKGVGNFIKVYERPHWWINGVQLKQGTQQIKLQLKGKAVLTTEIGTTPIAVECNNGTSEGATIEGEGIYQGQGKGRITFSQCNVQVLHTGEKCALNENITTKQTKSYLATIAGRQTKYVEVFEPTEGPTAVFAVIKVPAGCGGPINVEPKGSVAAEIIPGGVENQEGLLVFPATPISKVLHEEQEPTIKMKVGEKEAKFEAIFGARLASNEKFGVFGGN